MKKESKYFKKIFYSYLVIFTVLTVIVEILVCSSIVSGNRAKSIKLETFFEENFSAMENKILSISQVVNLLSESEEVKAFSETPYNAYRGENYYLLYKLSDTISNYMVSYLNAECRIFLIKAEDEVVFDSRTAVITKNIDTYFAAKGIDREQVEQAFQKSEEFPDRNVMLMSNSEGNSFISYLCWHRYTNGRYIYYFVEFDKNYFFPVLGINPGEFFAVINKSTKEICVKKNSEEQKVNKALKNIGVHSLSDKSKIVSQNGIFTRESQMVKGMIYAYHNPGVYSVSGYFIITLLLLLLWFLLMVAGFYLSRYLARRLYGPVHNVFGILSDVYHQEHDDDMMFLSESVADLVSNNKRLQELAEKNKVYLKRSFLKDMLTGNMEREQIKANLREYNLMYLQKSCLCVICEYENIESDDETMDYQKLQTLRSIFINAVEEYMSVNVSCEVVNIDRSRFAVIMNETEPQKLNKVLLGLANLAEDRYNFVIIMGVGKTVSEIYDIDDSYMSALNLLEYRFVLGSKYIIRAEDLEELGKTSYYYPVEVEKNLIYNVLEGNIEKSEDILANIFYVNFIELSLDKYNIKDLKFAITATIKRILKQINKNAEEIFGEDVIIYLELNAASDVSEIETSVRRIIGEITRYILDNSQSKKRSITQSIIHYIDENYHLDISLGDVAAHFCLSEGHIGRLLKNDMNISFKQYLNERRIEVAKELLLSDKNLSVGEVATMVGCNSAMTFIRMFKKYTGISPGEYKKSQA